MKSITRSWIPVAALALSGVLGSAAEAQDEQAQRMQSALASPERSAEAKARDEISKPIEVVQFLGIETGDTVLDVIAAGGWFTEVLSAAVGPSGKVYSQNPAFFLERGGDEFLAREQAQVERLGNVEPVHGELTDADLQDIDAAVTSMNFHDVYNSGGAEVGAAFLESIYDTLKAGGVLGIIDHVGIAGQDNAALHRVELAATKEALESAGFVVEAESDLLANPADDHSAGVRDPSLDGKSDRFLILARKPM